MRKFAIAILVGVFLFASAKRAFADSGWETAGKILTGVVIGHVAGEILRNPPPRERQVEIIRPSYHEYRVWVPGRYKETPVYEMVPERYEKRLVEREDGTLYEIEVKIPPSTRPVIIREWIPGRWETRIARCR
jgi:hypothetical protein